MKQIRQEELKEVLDVLEEVLKELGVNFYLIGAIAKEYWYRSGNKRIRATKDVDFAVLVPSKEVYSAVRERLREHQFGSVRGNELVMISPDGLEVDLLPFGEIDSDSKVQLMGQAVTNLKTEGFMEVYKAGTVDAQMGTGHVFKTATLPGIVLLKLIAYDDRPEERQKDARDVAGIIQHFFDLQAQLIYEHHDDLYADGQPDRKMHEIAAIVIGREMKKMCGDNQTLHRRLVNILMAQIKKGQASAFVRQMVGETGKTVEEMVAWLTDIKQGLTEEITNI